MFSEDKLQSVLKSKPLDFKGLAKSLNIPLKSNREFSKIITRLIRQGKLQQTADRMFYVPTFLGEETGIIRLTGKGFGFVDFEDQSFFIPPTGVNTAMDRDEVLIKYFKAPGKEESYSAIVHKVVKRNKASFVGRVINGRFGLTIKPFDARVRGNFEFDDVTKVAVDQEVKVKITGFKKGRMQIDLDKILGHKDDVSMDILIAIEDSMIPNEFDFATLDEAQKVPETIDGESKEGREDIREKLVITIDGDDTKDFDDAIEVTKLENGNYLLGVHIADVTHYVKEGSALDDEAKRRGTSVYLADRVIPMLPEALSNGICSLNPHVDRFTLSADMEIDKHGNTVNHKLYPSIINSKHRLTYKEVNQFYEGKLSFGNPELETMLTEAKVLADIIRDYKRKEGYIDFEIEESKLVIDENGKTTDIVVRERAESEMLIEDFMVRANETVAKHAFDAEKPFIYRVHDKPDIERVTSLQNVVKMLGIDVKIPSNADPKEFATAINQLKESRYDDFMKIMMLRTMAKAIYSPSNIGHFGLASQNYTHFTSPIRRYPDLMVHRMTREYFFNNKDMSEHFASILPGIAEHSSQTEQTAVELERKVADIKKAEFYEQFIGASFFGNVMSVMKFGMFVEFENKVDGLLHVSNLMDGKYDIKESNLQLSNGKRTFTIGDKIEVTVVGVMKTEGKIDVVLTEHYDEWKKKDQRDREFRAKRNHGKNKR